MHVLNDAPDLQVVGSAGDGAQAFSLGVETCPDLVIIDLELADGEGVELIRRLRTFLPQARLLVLTLSERPEDLFAALQAGAGSYLLKSVTTQELLEAIQDTCAGQRVVDRRMLPALIDEFVRLQNQVGLPDPLVQRLTRRECQVLSAVVQGLSNPQIGERLGLSPLTVKAHLRNILDKLGCHTRTEAAAWAARHLP